MWDSPISVTSSHSRQSSGASDCDSPLTQSSSFHEHIRFPSTGSSTANNSSSYDQIEDSPSRVQKTNTLDDLVEEPYERDEDLDLCCQDSVTQHQCHCEPARQCSLVAAIERPSLDYSLADGFNSDGETSLPDATPRRGSGGSPVSHLASRIGSRLPSFSRRLRDKAPPSPIASRQGVRSAPTSRVPSRTSSFRLSSLNKSVVKQIEVRDVANASTPPQTPTRSTAEEEHVEQASNPTDLQLRPTVEDPIDRKALASTPLLPKPLIERLGSEEEVMQSPLQSPTVADSPIFFPLRPSPLTTPVLQDVPTPPLSTQSSLVSFGMPRNSASAPLSDIPALDMGAPQDEWSSKLGHANFRVLPEPYVPQAGDLAAVKQHLEDWESARKQFMNQAARTSEHYGPTSQIYKLTESKWATIDAKWKKSHELVVARAEANGESPVYQPLAEPMPATKLPNLVDTNNTGKFPNLDDADIVGPMVQYAKISPRSSRKTAFLRFFSDLRSPGNTLGRSASGLGR
ncbi:hypothetical protein MBLNU459_g6234t1 [Dothideomycetes sp. NU459]